MDGRSQRTPAELSGRAASLASDRRAARTAARRAKTRRSIAISTVSTIVVLGGLTALIVTSPGWPTVRETFFSWPAFKESFPDVLRAFWLDVRMFVIVEVIVLVLALGIALCRVTRAPALFPFKLLATVYTDIFRGIPTILVVYLIGFGVPALQLTGVPTDPVVLGCAALSLSYSAYVAEVYRAGIDSVHRSQTAAALSLGLTGGQAMRFVVLPQAVRRVLPPLLNDFISLQKDVALVSIIGPQEAFRVAQIYQGQNFNFTPLVAAAALYIAVTFPLARILDRMQARERRRREAALA
ncbi:MAG TPA: amino acid ABC transporter permease [Solirubrobacteraceae bacterium]|nr:amino acid ABC transporter permease [Solirubrobacteraceae bacterium]